MNGSRVFPNGFQGRHMLISLGAFFGVMLIVNGIFVYFAISTFNGLSTRDAYRKGLAYNQRIADARAQRELGWTGAVKSGPLSGWLTVEISGRNGRPVKNLHIEATLMRPVSDRFDIPLKLEEAGAGHYRAFLGNIDRGNWVLHIRASKPVGGKNQVIYRMKKRLWLKQSK